jgi:hypothetical protein
MDLEIRTEENAVVVTISGRLDAVTAPDYERRIRELIESGNTCFVVDFEQLEYISSAPSASADGQVIKGEGRAGVLRERRGKRAVGVRHVWVHFNFQDGRFHCGGPRRPPLKDGRDSLGYEA